MKDEIGDRMKKFYEDRTRITLPRRTYTIIRIDGKAFHTYTKGLKRPFDDGLINDMDETACYLCKNIQGAKFAFVQSDEISILLTDFDKIGTDAWFDGNIQKMVSVASSMATAKFNELRRRRSFDNMKTELLKRTVDDFHKSNAISWMEEIFDVKLAEFDARVFTIPCDYEVENYFIWRQKDAVRNSISSVAQSLYSHKELENKSSDQKQEMIFQKGINWNDYAPMYKRGRFIFKQQVEKETPFVSVDKKQTTFMRSVWVSDECPTFTQDREFLLKFIPKNE
jgi:tRNA(His) 5'-end guanylyltransferase